MAEEIVLSQLAKARERLLDLTMRNRLLNYVPTKRQTIRIVDERPEEIWRLLITDGKKLGFLAREEHELFDGNAAGPEADSKMIQNTDALNAETFAKSADDAEASEQVFVLPELDLIQAEKEGAIPGRYRDNSLQTALTGESLQTNLLRIYQSAYSVLQERGVNFLFLAVGFLEWKHTATYGDRVFKAPILLIPVGLERSSARTRFKLFALEDEPVLNPCLIRKLQDYRIAMPPCGEDWADFDIEAYLSQVSQAISDQPGWSVSKDICLGLFSFTKYLMYMDLDAQRWPKGSKIAQNPMIRALCGDEEALPSPSDLPAAGDVDQQITPEQTFQVLDADSSQQTAILHAKAGQSLVIQGPPGTGKSQTITNIIAECLAQKKTVLFVSEKMAALGVVKSRLDRVGLGDFVLELHSTKANRKSLTAELARVLEQGRPSGRQDSDGAAKLSAVKERLNKYVNALHNPFGPAGMTPFQAMGRILLLKDVPSITCEMPGYEGWIAQRIDELRELIANLSRQLSAVWPPAEHPWRGARLTLATGQVQKAANDIIIRLLPELTASTDSAQGLAAALDVAAPDTIEAILKLLEDAELLTTSPEPAERLLMEPLWDNPPEELKVLLVKLRTYTESRQWLEGRYEPDKVEQVDWQGMLNRCAKFWLGFGRLFRRSYWADRKVFKDSRIDGRFPEFTEVVSDLKRLAAMHSLKIDLEQARILGEKYFDSAWHDASSSLENLLSLGKWLQKFRACVRRGGIGASVFRLAAAGADRSELVAKFARLRQTVAAWQADWSALTQAIHLDDSAAFGQPVAQAPLSQVAQRLELMTGRHESLLDWSQYQDSLQTCEKSPLASFTAKVLADGLDPNELVLAMEKQFLNLWMNDVLANRPELRRFNGRNHEADQSDFALLDKQWVERTSARLQIHLAVDRPANSGGYAQTSQMGILSGELRRKRGGRTIRKLLVDAKDAVQKLKPCFMMSPLSVAQFIDPAGMRFDVVVFDEASQVEPADALGAVARGSQLILVGDPKQLPPTSFFAGLSGEGDAVEEEGAAGLADMESILDKGLTVLPSTRLRWHYRSRHESLIAFSNREFYDNDLVVFPSSHADRNELGLSMQLDASDVYDRGRSQTNRGQAKRIAKCVFEHATRCPHKSLGVGAFSQRQQQAILDEVEHLRRDDDSAEEFFDPNRQEPFFVKNLETIQGDERDVILLSVGYGRSQSNDRVSMNFGPLNQDGGWRRLNVLVTRARQKCVVFSSIRGDDLDLSATPAKGVHSLKGYLDYALTGRLPEIEVGQGDFGSDFERAVYNALVEKGLRLHKQVGCAGYAIDLAVVDPENPGKYLLGIECDGATYHGSATARDRDRLRQQVLEDLGWRIHRIWSTQWFQKPQSEIERVLETVQKAKAGLLRPRFMAVSPAPQPTSHAQESPSQPAQSADAIISVQPYKCFTPRQVLSSDAFYTESVHVLATHIAEIVSVEGPIHEDELARRMAAIFGMSRAGGQIAAKVMKAAQHAERIKTIVRRGQFLWLAGMGVPCVRNRNSDGPRNIDLICAEEIGQAAWLLLKAQFGMSRQDLITQTARALGFNNTGVSIASAIETALEVELKNGRILDNVSSLCAVDAPSV